MKAPPGIIGDDRGFSLIEIIMVIVVASVMFAMMFAYFNRSLSESALPVTRLNQSMDLTTVAERITEHYRQDQFQQATLTAIRNNLNIAPPNNPYGNNFAVVTNEFITFNNYNDGPAGGAQNILKITIRHTQTDERLTLLLSQW